MNNPSGRLVIYLVGAASILVSLFGIRGSVYIINPTLVIFFIMISATLSLPTPSRMGLDPNNPTIRRVAALTEDVRKYMTILTGVDFLVGMGDTVFLLFLGVYAIMIGTPIEALFSSSAFMTIAAASAIAITVGSALSGYTGEKHAQR